MLRRFAEYNVNLFISECAQVDNQGLILYRTQVGLDNSLLIICVTNNDSRNNEKITNADEPKV